MEAVRSGEVHPDDAVAELRRLPFADLGFARVDHHRPLRQGMPEAVYGPGKTPVQCAAIVGELLSHDEAPVVLTRASADQQAAALAAHPDGRATATTVTWRPAPLRPERIMVVTAGTADGPVADECAAVLAAYGFEPGRLDDVGVAGLHRLLAHLDPLVSADAVVVVAGMAWWLRKDPGQGPPNLATAVRALEQAAEESGIAIPKATASQIYATPRTGGRGAAVTPTPASLGNAATVSAGRRMEIRTAVASRAAGTSMGRLLVGIGGMDEGGERGQRLPLPRKPILGSG